MRVLITGAGGFAGAHLSAWLSGRPDVEIHGVSRKGPRAFDLLDAEATRRAVAEVRPERIFHFAAESRVSQAWAEPGRVITVNVECQVNLLEAMRREAPSARVLVTGSAEEYGEVAPSEMPVRESAPLRPVNAYGLSKVAQDLLAWQYARDFGLYAVRTRAFNHTGPGQRAHFVAGDFARQIALAEAGKTEPVIRVGNLEAVRDFCDVRDVVRAYWLALDRGAPGDVYNVASGKGRTIRELLDALLSRASVKIRVEVDPAKLRPKELSVSIGDSSKLTAATGWRPEIPFEKTLEDLLENWREKVRAGKAEIEN